MNLTDDTWALIRRAVRDREGFTLYGVRYEPAAKASTTPREELEAAAFELEALYQDARQDLLVQGERSRTAKDKNGRYLLLDAMTALVNAKAALVGTS